MRLYRKHISRQLSLFLICILILSSLFFSRPPIAEAAYSSPTLEISTEEISPGQSGIVAISGWNIPDPGLAGIELNVLYDPLKVEINSLEKTSGDAFTLLEANFSQPGIVRIAGVKLPGVSGDIVITHLGVKAKEGASGTTELKLEIKDLTGFNSHSNEFTSLQAQSVNGKVILSSATGQEEGIDPLSMTLANLPQAVLGESYQYTFKATNGTLPYTWSATGIPEGLTLNPQTGEISGMPSANAGDSLIQVTVTDSSTPAQMVSSQVLIDVKAQPNSSAEPNSETLPGKQTPSSLPQVVRAGQDRYQTALQIALGHFLQSGSKGVLVANGYAPADALAGAPLAYQLKAPILLGTKEVSGANTVRDFLTLTHTVGGQVVLLGSTGVLDPSYESGFLSMTPQRLGGQNRRETAVQIARKLRELRGESGTSTNETVVIVNENAFVDAISIAPFAAQEGWPILLTQGDELSPETSEYLNEEKPSSIIVIGSTGVVSENVWTSLQSKTKDSGLLRIGGTDRFETNALVLDWAQKRHPERFTQERAKIAFANGDADDVIDALAGASLGMPIVLIHNKDELNTNQLKFLKGLGSVPSEIFGSSGVIAQKISWNE